MSTIPPHAVLKKLIVQRYLQQNKCIDCAESRWFVLENDHIAPNKIKNSHGNSVRTLSKCPTIDSLLLELKKCQVVCIKCHRKRTHQRKENPTFRTYSAMKASQDRTPKKEHNNLCKCEQGCCCHCGEVVSVGNEFLFDWDHLDPETKMESISDMVKNCKSLDTIDNEIQKCQLLCCVCHRIKTMQERKWCRIDQQSVAVVQHVDDILSKGSTLQNSNVVVSTESALTTKQKRRRDAKNEFLLKEQKEITPRTKHETGRVHANNGVYSILVCNLLLIKIIKIIMCLIYFFIVNAHLYDFSMLHMC